MKERYNYRSLNKIDRGIKSIMVAARLSQAKGPGAVALKNNEFYQHNLRERCLNSIEKALSLSSDHYQNPRERERFKREREALVKHLYANYMKLSRKVDSDLISEGMQPDTSGIVGDLSNSDLPGNFADTLFTHHLTNTNSHHVSNGVYYRDRGNKRKWYPVPTEGSKYVSRPASEVVDNMWTNTDPNGGTRVKTLGNWQALPGKHIPGENPVRDRCIERGITYIHRGRSWPIAGYPNGFAWTTLGWGSGIEMFGGRALIYYNHINPINYGWVKWVKTTRSQKGKVSYDVHFPAAMHGAPGSAYMEYVPKHQGTPGCNANTVGMPGWNSINKEQL